VSKAKNTLRRDRTTFEWAILAVSVAAIAAIVAGLVIASIGYESGPADLRVSVQPDGAPTRFVLTVTNEGGATAEHVRVLVRRGRGSVEVELLAVPKGDVEEAFVKIGGRGRPTAQVQSYQEP
jgi:uncharacterized protein (TIGR02588 family)